MNVNGDRNGPPIPSFAGLDAVDNTNQSSMNYERKLNQRARVDTIKEAVRRHTLRHMRNVPVNYRRLSGSPSLTTMSSYERNKELALVYKGLSGSIVYGLMRPPINGYDDVSIDLREAATTLGYSERSFCRATLNAYYETDSAIESDPDNNTRYILPEVGDLWDYSQCWSGEADMLKDIMSKFLHPQRNAKRFELFCYLAECDSVELTERFIYHCSNVHRNGKAPWEVEYITDSEQEPDSIGSSGKEDTVEKGTGAVAASRTTQDTDTGMETEESESETGESPSDETADGWCSLRRQLVAKARKKMREEFSVNLSEGKALAQLYGTDFITVKCNPIDKEQPCEVLMAEFGVYDYEDVVMVSYKPGKKDILAVKYSERVVSVRTSVDGPGFRKYMNVRFAALNNARKTPPQQEPSDAPAPVKKKAKTSGVLGLTRAYPRERGLCWWTVDGGWNLKNLMEDGYCGEDGFPRSTPEADKKVKGNKECVRKVQAQIAAERMAAAKDTAEEDRKWMEARIDSINRNDNWDLAWEEDVMSRPRPEYDEPPGGYEPTPPRVTQTQTPLTLKNDHGYQPVRKDICDAQSMHHLKTPDALNVSATQESNESPNADSDGKDASGEKTKSDIGSDDNDGMNETK